MKDVIAMVAVGVCAAAITLGLASVGASIERNKWQRESVARGVAGYDETTGEWKWTVERKVAE